MVIALDLRFGLRGHGQLLVGQVGLQDDELGSAPGGFGPAPAGRVCRNNSQTRLAGLVQRFSMV